MMFVGYSKEHSGDVYMMWNPESGRIQNTRDVIWLKRMYYGDKNFGLEVSNDPAPGTSVPDPSPGTVKFATSEAKEGTSEAASSSANDDNDDEDSDDSVTEKDGYLTTTRSGRHVFRPERLGQAVNANIDMLSSAELNYYAALAETDESKVALVGAAMGVDSNIQVNLNQ